MKNLLTPMLEQQGVVMLDGGLATELERRGCDLRDDLWSAGVLIDQPDLVRQVHADYLAAGADCIVSASYQATVEGFVKKGLSQAGAERLLQKSVEIALEVRDAFWSVPANRQGRLRPLVAASIGPYGAFLADGSEFTGDYDLDEQGLTEFHADRWKLLAGSGADLLACETIPSATEARVLMKLLEQTTSTIAWFSFSCRDDTHISDGTELAAIARELSEAEHIVAVGVKLHGAALHPWSRHLGESRHQQADSRLSQLRRALGCRGQKVATRRGSDRPPPGQPRLARPRGKSHRWLLPHRTRRHSQLSAGI